MTSHCYFRMLLNFRFSFCCCPQRVRNFVWGEFLFIHLQRFILPYEFGLLRQKYKCLVHFMLGYPLYLQVRVYTDSHSRESVICLLYRALSPIPCQDGRAAMYSDSGSERVSHTFVSPSRSHECSHLFLILCSLVVQGYPRTGISDIVCSVHILQCLHFFQCFQVQLCNLLC